MTRLLSLFGLMRVSEHEKVKAERTRLTIVEGAQDDLIGDIRAERDDWRGKHASVCAGFDDMRAKYKQAVAVLEKQAGEIATLREEAEHLRAELWSATEQARENAADAPAMRRKRQIDRDRRKGNG